MKVAARLGLERADSEAHAPTHYAIQTLNLKTFFHVIHTLQKWTVLKETGIKNKGHAEVKKIKRKQT